MNKGKIYKLYNEYGTYYGSTTSTLKERFNKHKCDTKKRRNGSSKILFKNGCIPNIELLEEIKFNDIQELRDREAYYIKNLECVNKNIPNRTNKEYRQDNKELLKQKKKEYDQCNKEKLAKQMKEYYEVNKEIIKEKKKEYYANNKEKQKEYYEVNKQNINEKRKIKLTCECGSTIRKTDYSKHCKTKKHQNFINNQNIKENK